MTVDNCDDLVLHIPPRDGEDAGSYQATLGHKANHKFAPGNNCRYAWTDSARFGLIMSVVTTREVRRGEELFTDYNYPANTKLPWYRDLYQEHVAAGNSIHDWFNKLKIQIWSMEFLADITV